MMKSLYDRVFRWTGISVSMGGGPTRTLAKIANRYAKMNKSSPLYPLIRNSQIDDLLAETSVGDVWGIGPERAVLLKKNGITSAIQLRDADDRWIRRNLTLAGLRTVNELRGISSLDPKDRKGQSHTVVSSRSFGRTVSDEESLREAVSFFSFRASEKLYERKMRTGSVTVFVSTDRYGSGPGYFNRAVVKPSGKTDDPAKIAQLALEGLKRIYRPGFEYRKAGVVLSDLSPESEGEQLDLFSSGQHAKRDTMASLIRNINQNRGKDTIRPVFARQDIGRQWQTKFEKLSPNYTTSWEEIPVVSALGAKKI
jgi:DNA polymerase V